MYLRFMLPSLRRNYLLVKQITRCSQRLFKTKSSEQELEIIPKDIPIKYSTSKAGRWKARYTNSGENYDDTPRIQGLIVVISLAAFMIHFFILREENDLDDYVRFVEATVPLRLKEAQLRIEIEQGKKEKKDVSELVTALDNLVKRKTD